MTKSLIDKVRREEFLSPSELCAILDDDHILPELTSAADQVRAQKVGDTIYLRGLIEFGNLCQNDCYYCGLRAGQKNVQRYRLTVEEVLENASLAKRLGYATLVLQSGEEKITSDEEILKIIHGIKALGLILTLSIGEKTFKQYERYKQAGADRFLLRIETTDEKLYAQFHPKLDFKGRIECLKNLKSLGYELGTGVLVGLPGQTNLSLARDILFFKEIGADMIGLGPFIPTPGTPLENAVGGDFNRALKVIALTRLLLPYANIPATTAFETLKEDGRFLALKSGANVVMPNATATCVRQKYALYPGKIAQDLSPAETLAKVLSDLEPLGRAVDLQR